MTKSVFSEQYQRFCSLLIDARRRAKLTQAQLSKRLSAPQSFVSKFERGERRLDVVEYLAVARALKIDALKLLRELDSAPPIDGKAAKRVIP